jgi:hypothetical protein
MLPLESGVEDIIAVSVRVAVCRNDLYEATRYGR